MLKKLCIVLIATLITYLAGVHAEDKGFNSDIPLPSVPFKAH